MRPPARTLLTKQGNHSPVCKDVPNLLAHMQLVLELQGIHDEISHCKMGNQSISNNASQMPTRHACS